MSGEHSRSPGARQETTARRASERMRSPLLVRDITHTRPTGPVRVPEIMIVFTVEGWAEVVAPDGVVIPAEAGTIVTVPTEVTCCGIPNGYARTLTMHAHPEYVSDQLRWLPALHPLVHLLQRSIHGDQALHHLQVPAEVMASISPRLVRMAQLPERANAQFTLLSLAAEVFDVVGRAVGTNRRPSESATVCTLRPRREVIAAISLLRRNLARPWRMPELAREVRLSGAQLNRSFREQIGVSPAAYLSQLRAERMAELLATESIGVAEAAREVGWSSHALATRIFRQRYGVSPSEYASIARAS